MKKITLRNLPGIRVFKLPVRTVKCITFLLIILSASIPAQSFAQTATLTGKSLSLEEILPLIEKQTGYAFLYKENLLSNTKPVSLRASNMPLLQLLDTIFKYQPLDYTIKGKTIFLSRKPAFSGNNDSGPAQPGAEGRQLPAVKLLVTDSAGKPLTGASVTIKKRKSSKITGADGTTTISAAEGDIIEVSYVGFYPRAVKVGSNTSELTISLKPLEKKLDEVVVNAGILTRKKESFTGAVSSFTGKEIRQIGNGNVLQSIKTLDPSFIITQNNNLGSNPNQLPSIQLRGTTSLTTANAVQSQFGTDPNQPLFILNGMESSLQQIVNLDINRIASITLLKDAASTALYGSKAANGVVVVETIKPRPGDLRVSYTTDFRAEIPDLSGYNMMNATELLKFQKLSGYYDPGDRQNSQLILDTLYNARLKAVLGGLNSYWLNVPLRNAFTSGHVLQVDGGSEEFQYNVTLSYRSAPGVMKESGKNTWGGSVDLSYRKKKVNFINRTYVEGSLGKESPYGSFSSYVNMAPFYRKYDANGHLYTGKYLESFEGGSNSSFLDTYQVPNPIYNATLNSKNETANFNVQNNLSFIWDIDPALRLTSGLLVNKGSGNITVFVPADNTTFDAVDISQKGSYNYVQLNTWGYSGNVMLTYQKILREKHSLTGNIRAEVNENNNQSIGLTAVGFPDGVEPNPSFAYGYQPGAKPSYADIKTRQVNALSSVNYAFAGKYYFDATFRIDGSTVFGSAKKYSPFWAAGIGWTINKEKFLEDVSWLSLLRLRGNIGTNGNQQLGTFVSSSVYGYTNTVTGFGTGLYLNQLGTPNLSWQSTQQISIGMDLATNNNRFLATLNAYRKLTDPLIVQSAAAASVGVSNYALNAGRLTVNGVEAIIKYSPVFKPQKGIQWTLGLTGSIYKSKYAGFSSILEKENEDARNKFNDESDLQDVPNYLRRYLDGHSPDDIWAVRSLGIDPATGNEILLKKDGTHTFYYDPNDEVVVGTAMPKVQGVISSSLNIKGFSMSVNLRYSIGQSNFNTAVFNKVENINFSELAFNQDKRALYERWKQPGDVAMFKNINLVDPNLTTTYSPPTSRFIQKENFLSGESISAGYEFSGAKYAWLRKVKANSLRINGYMNDVFRISNVQYERGTDYPFARNFSLSMSLFF